VGGAENLQTFLASIGEGRAAASFGIDQVANVLRPIFADILTSEGLLREDAEAEAARIFSGAIADADELMARVDELSQIEANRQVGQVAAEGGARISQIVRDALVDTGVIPDPNADVLPPPSGKVIAGADPALTPDLSGSTITGTDPSMPQGPQPVINLTFNVNGNGDEEIRRLMEETTPLIVEAITEALSRESRFKPLDIDDRAIRSDLT
jgi:vacuolar-type H+-ATPase subunit H